MDEYIAGFPNETQKIPVGHKEKSEPGKIFNG
jgi:hypothetical protein